MASYQPPHTLTPAILNRVSEIAQALGRMEAPADQARALRLRRINRVRTIQGSLAIEGNTLSEEQITAILDGKRVIAPPREVQEVRNGDCAPFIEFMLGMILAALQSSTEQVTEQVIRLLAALKATPLGTKNMLSCLKLSHRPSFMQNYLQPALEAGLVEMTQPDSPRSPTQKYRLTGKGRAYLQASRN